MRNTKSWHRRPRKALGLFLAVAATLGAGSGLAQQDNDAPVRLEADKAQLNNATGESVYTGNVRLTRGETVITGDRLELYTTDDGDIERAIVTGEPATYKGKPQKDEGTVRGEAPRMIYYAGGDERIRMTKGAVLWRDKDRLEGETVVYRVAEDTVEAESSGSGGDRINITLTPDSDSEGD